MLVAVVSDTHSSTPAVKAALALIAGRDVGMILHCGDICDGDTVRLFPAHTQFVLGNCDHDPDVIDEAATGVGATLHRPFGFVEPDGVPIAFVHGDDPALLRDLESAGAFDFLFYGHTHAAKEHRVGRTRVINPGALYRAATKTFVILDTATGEVERVAL